MAGLAEAILLAAQSHYGQTEFNGNPYILHPLRLMMAQPDEDAQIVAVLHDVVEDTGVTLDDLLAAGFAPHLVQAVDCLTRRPDESYEAYILRLKPNALARRVKLADLRDNLNVLRLPEIREKDIEHLYRYHAAWQELNR